MKLYVSTSCLADKYDLSNILNIYDKLNIQNIEIGIFKYCDFDAINLLKKYNFNYIVHHYFPPPKDPFIINLASQDKQILQKSIDQIIKSLDFCANFNIKYFSLHAGFRVDPDTNLKFYSNNIPNYESSFGIFKESIAKIINYAEKINIKIAIENNVLAEYNLIDGQNKFLLMCELWEFEKLFQEIHSKNLGILLDLGHLRVTSNLLKFNPCEFIYKLGDKIYIIHIHENNGKLDEHKCIKKKEDWSLNIIKKYFKNKIIPIVLECKCEDEEDLKGVLLFISKELSK